MKPLFVIIFAVFVVSTACLRADEASHQAAAEALLASLDMEKMISESIDQNLQAQIKQNPAIAQFEPQMRAFFAKYMSWASLKGEIVKIYAAEFTEAELKQLADFNKTPLGKKAAQKMPLLVAKGAAMGQKRVEEHLPELQAAIQEAVTKKEK